MKKTLRIVELENGMYAVQTKQLFGWGYLSKTNYYVFTKGQHIIDCCLLETLEEAEESMETICRIIRNNRDPLPKVIRVVKQIKV